MRADVLIKGRRLISDLKKSANFLKVILVNGKFGLEEYSYDKQKEEVT